MPRKIGTLKALTAMRRMEMRAAVRIACTWGEKKDVVRDADNYIPDFVTKTRNTTPVRIMRNI
jgi:hypothetical protein